MPGVLNSAFSSSISISQVLNYDLWSTLSPLLYSVKDTDLLHSSACGHQALLFTGWLAAPAHALGLSISVPLLTRLYYSSVG